MKDIPQSERPLERFLQTGAGAMSNAELLAIMLQSGTREHSVLNLAHTILSGFGQLQELNDVTTEELMKVPGIGRTKAVRILAGIEFGRRISESKKSKPEVLMEPEDGYRVLGPQMQHLSQEHFVVLFLDTKNYMIGQKTIFIGSLNKAIVHPREVFKEAIKRSSASIVCAHNHPSGDAEPSAQDIQLTHRLAEVGELVGIPLVDHLIIGEDEYVSLRERGYLE